MQDMPPRPSPVTPTHFAFTTPEVSVIIVNFNGRHHLKRCLASLEKTRGVSFEIIVADNGSTDDSVAWIEKHYPRVRVVELGRNLGFGAANSSALEVAAAPLVAFLNNDTVVHPNWLAPLVDTLRRFPDVVAACSTLRLLSHPRLYNARGGAMTWLGYGFDRFFGYPQGEQPPVEEVLFPTAAACLVNKETFLELGGFDPAFFMYNEDVDFGWRAWIAGRRVVVCRDSVVWHAFGGTTARTGGARTRYLLGSRHLVRSVLKNYEARKIPRVLWNLYKTWWRQRAVRLAFQVTLWNLLRLPSTLSRRRQVQRRRLRPDGELFERGLILRAPFPPAHPALPHREHPARLFRSGVLFPGQDSARGRLGYGWYFRSTAKGAAFAETTAQALCWLKVDAGAEGTLAVTLRAPVPHPPQGHLEIEVNGVGTRHPTPSPHWQTVEVPAKADARGLLRVVLRAPESIPHESLANWDFRPVALHVASLRFFPAPKGVLPGSPRVSVVIPTYNRWAVLELTLEALCRQTFGGFEVVVVDDGSSDGTAERLRAWAKERLPPFELKVLQQTNAGPAAARNRGVAAATGDLVVFLGDDTIPDPDFLEAHIRAQGMHQEPCAIVGLTLWDEQRLKVTPFLRYVNLWGDQFAYGLFEDGEEMTFTCLYTSNLSVPRALLEEKPFHEGFARAAWEDAELGYRLCRRGVRILYCAKARTRHVHPFTLSGFLRRQVLVGREIDTLVRLHPELADDPVLPPLKPSGKVLWLGRLAALGKPLAAALDRLGVPLPKRLYRALVLGAFYRGRRTAGA